VADDTDGPVVVVVVCVVAEPAPVSPALESPLLESSLVEGDVLVLVPVDVLELLLVVVTVAPPVVGTVNGGAPWVLVPTALLPLPQAASTSPAAKAAIRANMRERVGIGANYSAPDATARSVSDWFHSFTAPGAVIQILLGELIAVTAEAQVLKRPGKF
jgi:hypothetical protein